MAQGAISRAVNWLLGDNWKSSALGIIGALAKFLPGVALIQADWVPHALSGHWPEVLKWCLFIGGASTWIQGRIQEDKK